MLVGEVTLYKDPVKMPVSYLYSKGNENKPNYKLSYDFCLKFFLTFCFWGWGGYML